MAYNDSSTGKHFSSKKELIEHMLDVHKSPFYEGDYAPVCKKILEERAKKGNKEAEEMLKKYD